MDKSQRITDEVYLTTETPPSEEGQTIRFIDVHIYNTVSLEDIPSEEIEPDQDTQIVDQEDITPVQPRPYKTILLVLASIVCLIAIGASITFFVLPVLNTPTVNVTIIPISKRFDTTQSIIVPSRELPTIVMSQQKTVATSGYGHTDAQSAHGIITFYNSLTVAQTIPGGTLLTASNGVQITTDQDVTIPAVQYPTLGYASVLAHSVITGPLGNIAASSIYGPCCRVGISAVNAAFSGGQIARNYRMVQQSDITTAVNDLKTSLLQSAQAAFQTQVQNGESLLPLNCTLSSKPDHLLGVEATQVQVVVSESCTGIVYDSQALQNRVQQITSQYALQQFGSNYSLSGQITDTITQATSKGNSITLKVRLSASYDYRFSSLEQQRMISSIAGKSRNEAISTLLHTDGVQSVSVSAGTLPDSTHIRLLVIYEQ